MTNLPVETPEQAREKLSWYLCRWQIEVYLQVLKSGCRVEQLQLETRERLEPALGFSMIIAWRVLYLTMLGRDCPEMPCNTLFADEEWKAVYLVTRRKVPPWQPPSLETMVRMVATLGGASTDRAMVFLDRKHSGSVYSVFPISRWRSTLSAISWKVVDNGMAYGLLLTLLVLPAVFLRAQPHRRRAPRAGPAGFGLPLVQVPGHA